MKRQTYKIPDDLHPEVQKTMNTKTVEISLPRKAHNHVNAKDMQDRADLVQKGYNLMDKDYMTLMGTAKTDREVKSLYKQVKQKIVNFYRQHTSAPEEFTHDNPLTIKVPYKFDKIKENVETLATSTGLTPAQVMQTIVLKAVNQRQGNKDRFTHAEQVQLLKERTGAHADGETGNLDEMKTDYSKKDATMKVNQE